MTNWITKFNFGELFRFNKNKKSIKAQLITTFLTRAVLIFFVYIITFYFFRQSITEYEQIIQNADKANRIPTMYNQLIDDFKNYLVDANSEYNNFKSSIVEVEQLVAYIEKNTKQDHRDSIAQLKGISHMFKIIDRKTSLAIEYRSQGKLDKANREFYELSQMSEFVKENINQYISKELSYSIAARERIFRKSVMIVSFSSLFIIVITVLGIIYGIKFSTDTAKAILSIANDDYSEDKKHLSYGEEELDHLYQKFVELKKNEKEYVAQLYASENRLSTILNEMTDCVIITDDRGLIEYINPISERVFGYNLREEIYPNNICSLIPNIGVFIPEIIEKNQITCAGLEREHSTTIVDGKFQHIAFRANRELFPIEMGIAEAELDGSKKYIFVVHDITEHKEVEKMKDEFISIVSHELRTPLTSIKGAVQLALSNRFGEIPEQSSNLLKIANDNCTRLTNLINDILDVNKISQGKMEFFFETISLISVVKEAVDNNLSYANQYDVHIVFEADKYEDITVSVDKSRFIQVLTNLLSNAVKFSHKNETVEVKIKSSETAVDISIVDKGVGIPTEFQDKLFEKFMQADASSTRAKGGTGLGLNITKLLVERMSGTISFVSQENVGTTFTVTIPTVSLASKTVNI